MAIFHFQNGGPPPCWTCKAHDFFRPIPPRRPINGISIPNIIETARKKTRTLKIRPQKNFRSRLRSAIPAANLLTYLLVAELCLVRPHEVGGQSVHLHFSGSRLAIGFDRIAVTSGVPNRRQQWDIFGASTPWEFYQDLGNLGGRFRFWRICPKI